jgi:hypothetical protein
MLSDETIKQYRRMTLGEKLALVMRMTDENTTALLEGSPEVVRRRFELLRRHNDERNRNMLECIARTRRT